MSKQTQNITKLEKNLNVKSQEIFDKPFSKLNKKQQYSILLLQKHKINKSK